MRTKKPPEHYRAVRSSRRRTLYAYARDVLGLSATARLEASYSATWLVSQFPDHEFPEAIRKLCRGASRLR